MGRIIQRDAAADRVLHDVTTTVEVARATRPEMHADALRYLGSVLETAEALRRQLEDHDANTMALRGRRKAYNERANDRIHRVRDAYFNEIGRAAGDPVYNMTFPGGAGRYARATPANKPTALRLLAAALETHSHRRIPREMVEEWTTALGAEDEALDEVLRTLGPLDVEGRILRAQRTANAREGQRRLSGLKRYWLGEGLSEAEIHEVIPDRPRSRGPDATPADEPPGLDSELAPVKTGDRPEAG